ncbi:MAG: hypothetical protein GY703_24755 [Gammaproteobacteria bacterium]|nr:hypothetical protein [Gammaproteobacteria bacterium]
MTTQNNYVMQEQVRGLIPSIMKYDVTKHSQISDITMYLLSSGAVVSVYLFAMALSAN